MTRMDADPRTWLVGKHLGEQRVTPVEGWDVDIYGSAPLTLTLPGEDAILVKGTELEAHQVAELRKLVEMVDRCKTPEALADLEKMAEWVANWEPGDPGLSLGSGNGG
ncbi:hypothetical protein ACFXKK_06200 [Streptomyces globisporus]|uniref:hypothetical protein n=1 Tax=Streptomyces globisporus TaxID=1908 RepID=UPI0036594442